MEIALIGDVDVHSFREDRNYNVDVAFQPAEKPAAQLLVAATAPPAAPPRAGGRNPGRTGNGRTAGRRAGACEHRACQIGCNRSRSGERVRRHLLSRR